MALSEGLSASLTSGFHHARSARASGFCTFNGLMVSGVHLLEERRVSRIAIVDCDYTFEEALRVWGML